MFIANQDGAFSSSDGDTITDLDEKKRFAIRQSDAYAAYVRAQFLAPASPYEASSWALKLKEAQDGVNTPMLDVEAQARGVDRSVLIAKVIEKAAQLAYLEAVIAGVNGKHNDAIKLLGSLEDVQNYDWRAGYPEP